MSTDVGFRLTELDRTSWPEVRDQILSFTHEGPLGEPRSYPGYPRWPLRRCRPRLWPALERALWSRRSARALTTDLPSLGQLSRLLQFAHGVSAGPGRGPVASSGGLPSLDRHLANLAEAGLPS